MRLLIPIGLALLSIGLFVVYTNPAYQGVKVLQARASSYDEALNKSQELRALREQLLSRRNTFSAESLQRLARALPDNVDNIRLIIDINNVAARHLLSLRNLTVGDVSGGSRERSALAVGTSGEPIGSVSLGFSLSASYDEFLAFLRDLEASLRLIDVEKIAFNANAEDRYDFTLTIRTYWLH